MPVELSISRNAGTMFPVVKKSYAKQEFNKDPAQFADYTE